MKVPDVSMYGDWQKWAIALTRVLTESPQILPVTLPHYTTAQLTTGVPPNQDGLLIWHIDSAKQAYSQGGHWYMTYNNGLIV